MGDEEQRFDDAVVVPNIVSINSSDPVEALSAQLRELRDRCELLETELLTTTEELDARCGFSAHCVTLLDSSAFSRVDAAREQRLHAAFEFFDLDSNGELNENEFLEMGKAQCTLLGPFCWNCTGATQAVHLWQAMHPEGGWTPEKNRKAMATVPSKR